MEPSEKSRAPVGGIAADGRGGLVVTWEQDHAASVSWISAAGDELAVTGATAIDLPDLDLSEGVCISPPLVHAATARAIVSVYYCVDGYSRNVVVALDLERRAETRRWRVESSDARHVKLSVDGMLVWPADEGAGIARLD